MTSLQIARELGVSKGTVQNIEQRALAKLRVALGIEPPRTMSERERDLTRPVFRKDRRRDL